MENVVESLKRSSINIGTISRSVSETQKGIAATNNSVDNISRIIGNNTRIKRESFARLEVLKSRRQEASKRQEAEDAIESTKISTSKVRGITFASKSNKGPFSRLLGFLGYISAGFLLENLPTWIFMGKEFVFRIQSLVSTFKESLEDMTSIAESFGNIISNSFTAVTTLNFSEFSSGSVAKSFDELNLAVQGLGDNITDTFKLFTTPLTESLETGEEAPGLGEERTETLFPEITQEPQTYSGTYSGPEMTSPGTVSPQAVYAYIRQLGVPHIHALGILANIQGESGFEVGVTEKGGTKQGVGLFQYSYPSRKRRFLNAVPDYRTNWKGQIKYALTQDENTPLYLKKQFSSPEEAADDWMRNWENPDKSVYTERRRIHNNFIKNFKPQTSSTKPTTQISQVPTGNIKPIITSRYGDLRGKRRHGGSDLAVNDGTPLRAISDGVIVDSDYESGWGNFLVMRDNLGIYHLYGHMQSGYKRGGPVKKGEVIGKVGRSGRTTGPHLHWEAGTGWNGGEITGKFDPLNKYSRYAPFNTRPGITSPSTVAQISPTPKLQQPGAITPQRRGSEIVIIDDTQPQVSQTPYPTQQQSFSPSIDESTLLNNFIKNKLLLDLAYL